MYLTPDEFDAVVAQSAQSDYERLQRMLNAQRTLSGGLLRVAQSAVDDPEKKETLKEIEEDARDLGLLEAAEEQCTCTCTCTNCSGSGSSETTVDTEDETETNAELVDPETPGQILEAAASAAANDDEDAPSSGSLAEYRRNSEDAEDEPSVDGTPSSLSAWRKTEDGKQALEKKEERRPSLMDLLRAP